MRCLHRAPIFKLCKNFHESSCKNHLQQICQIFLVLVVVILCLPIVSKGTGARNNNNNNTRVVNTLYDRSLPLHHQQQEQKLTTTANSQFKNNKNTPELGHPQLHNETNTFSTAPIKLVLKDDSNKNYGSLQAQMMSRHSYNLSLSSSDAPDSIASSSGEKNATAEIIDNERINSTIDELSTSDTRLFPLSSSRRSDDEYDATSQTEDESVQGLHEQADNDAEQASASNLSEQKAIKELTKILSKGISGATNQVKLETLENWKRRQKERKVVKDNRAKLFEDLLTAAISTHPEKLKVRKTANNNNKNKQQRSKAGESGGHKTSSHSSTFQHKHHLPSLMSISGIDPDSAEDGDSVLQQLQNIASVADGRPTVASMMPSIEEPISPSDDGTLSQDESTSGELGGNSYESSSSSLDGGSGSSSEGGSGSSTSENEKNTSSASSNKKKIASSERPIVRQFKKIKKQISQRRKQLDQIKKLFNVELAINPKDGTLMGKTPSSSSKKKEKDSSSGEDKPTVHEIGDYTVIDDASSGFSSSKKKSSKKIAKMEELLNYLKENPEILASVMSELTTDSDPARNGGGGSDDETSSYQSLMDRTVGGGELSSASIRKTLRRQQQQLQQQHDLSEGNEIGATSLLDWNKVAKKKVSKLIDSSNLENLTGSSRLSSRKLRIRSGENMQLGSSPSINHSSGKVQIAQKKTADQLLLESLRERQLMNLARLDLVLAEKQQQQQSSGGGLLANKTMIHFLSPQSNSSSSYIDEINSAYDQKLSMSTDSTIDSIDNQTLIGYQRNSVNNQPTEDEVSQQQNYETQMSLDPQQAQQQQQQYVESSVPSSFNANTNVRTASSWRQPASYQQQPQQPYQLPKSYEHQLNQSDQQALLYQQHQRGQQQNQASQQQQQLQQQYNAIHHSSPTGPSATTNQRYNQQQQSQSHTLNRFTNWRDVSQSEASSSQRSGKTNSPVNTTFVPYDLTTGGSSNAVEAHRSPVSSLSGNSNSNNRQTNYQQQHHQHYSDSSVTRPGPQFVSTTYQASNSVGGGNGNSFPMKQSASAAITSSIAADTELTTAQPLSSSKFELDSDEHMKNANVLRRDEGANGVLAADEFEQSMNEHSRPVAPVDYFSAYKQEITSDTISPSRPRNIHSKRISEMGQPESRHEQMGGWF